MDATNPTATRKHTIRWVLVVKSIAFQATNPSAAPNLLRLRDVDGKNNLSPF
jgi:hypothetical protein